MASVKIIETIPGSESVVVRWEIIRDGQVLETMALNFGLESGLSATQQLVRIKRQIAEITEKRLTVLDSPPVAPDFSEYLDVEEGVDDLKPVVPLEEKRALKIAEIERTVLDFIAKKGDGNSRYNLQHQIAALASLVSTLEKDKDDSLSAEEKQALKNKRNRATQTWAWMEGVFTAQMQAQAAVAAMTDPAEVDAYQLDLTPFELTDPDVYLVEVWDKLEEE